MKLKEGIKTFINFGKDFIFPVFCLSCKKEGEWLCSKCSAEVDLSGVFFCPQCHKETEFGCCCPECLNKSFLFSHFAITPYREGEIISKLIHTLKYNFAEDVKVVFEQIIDEFVSQKKNLFANIDLIIPVPLHKKRFAERGFNQAEIIAIILSQATNLPLSLLLKRSRYTKKQAKLKRVERLENLKNAFVIEGDIQNKNILLVDDVFTTGATTQACAEALLLSGAKEVKGFSVARG